MKTVTPHAWHAGPALLARVGVMLLLAAAAIGTAADADLWGHLRFGQDIIRTGSIVHPDAYSFTTDRPWINHEWLSEVVFATAYASGGATGLVLLKVSVIAALLLVVWRHVTRIAPATGAAFWIVVFAFAGTYWRTHSLRPQLFSVLLFALFLVTLMRADAGQWRRLVVLPALMALWVNLHGGWIVGLGVLGFWSAVRCFERGRPWPERAWAAAAGLATLAATLVNPYGFGLWRFIGSTVGLSRPDIQDWGSVLMFPILIGVPWALTGALAALAIWRGGRPRVDYVATVILAGLASFRVGRLDAFFALIVVVLLAPELVRAWQSLVRVPSGRGGPSSVHDRGILVVTMLAALAMVVPTVRMMRPYVSCVTIGGSASPDGAAGRFIALNRLTGRMVTWFDWGQYAIWHFGPALQVSMDGRRETVYSDRLVQAHRRFYGADESAMPFVSELKADYIWVPSYLPIAARLRETDWAPIFSGGASVVFARPGLGPFQSVTDVTPAPRCFPGP